MRIYKYIPEAFVDEFLNKGRVLFRPLSYFRDQEDEQIRGDQQEGTRRFAPERGLAITNQSKATAFTLQHGAFESRAAGEEHIYVFCASTVCSGELAERFNADTCVEIVDVDLFARRLRIVLSRKNKRLIHGEVSYYKESDGPGATWQLPDQIAMSKIEGYAWQHEYRIAFASKSAFAFGNTRQQIVIGERLPGRKPEHYPRRFIHVGDLRAICHVHTFAFDTAASRASVTGVIAHEPSLLNALTQESSVEG